MSGEGERGNEGRAYPADFGKRLLEVPGVDAVAEARDVQIVPRVLGDGAGLASTMYTHATISPIHNPLHSSSSQLLPALLNTLIITTLVHSHPHALSSCSLSQPRPNLVIVLFSDFIPSRQSVVRLLTPLSRQAPSRN